MFSCLQLSSDGSLTAVGTDPTDILWPFSSNQVSVNLVITGNTLNFQPNYVSDPAACSLTDRAACSLHAIAIHRFI